ncbi:BLUF domain-containing protein [Muriicola soli]|uniref:BLUF domain-containing protein n=1 Tax=Muriicola soli TaxID=2507538 RepID=A0A411EBN5_9FLAO|nr:BLUF domain-containing protein [Muriicola soli]QBA65048.1 BLUF domain-containing protein [Muriicola soli]
MFSLVYRSVARPGFNLDQIQEMLRKARNFNHQQGITGCLLYHEGEFIQYLEGNQYKVLTLFDKIKVDSRHIEVELLSYAEREGRAFEKWDMAYENFFGENPQITHLKLMVDEYLSNKSNHTAENPSKIVFWEQVGSVLHGTRTSAGN